MVIYFPNDHFTCMKASNGEKTETIIKQSPSPVPSSIKVQIFGMNALTIFSAFWCWIFDIRFWEKFVDQYYAYIAAVSIYRSFFCLFFILELWPKMIAQLGDIAPLPQHYRGKGILWNNNKVCNSIFDVTT